MTARSLASISDESTGRHVVICPHFKKYDLCPHVDIRPENYYRYPRGGLPYSHAETLGTAAIRLKTEQYGRGRARTEAVDSGDFVDNRPNPVTSRC